MRAGLLVCVALSLGCSETADRRRAKAPSPAATATVIVAPSNPASDAGLLTGGIDTGFDGELTGLAFLQNGTLAVATDKEILTLDAAGALRRAPANGRAASLDSAEYAEGIVLEGKSDVVLLDAPTLRELYVGGGRRLVGPLDAIAIDGDAPSVLVARGGKLARFTLPQGKPRRVDHFEIVAGGTRAIVTWSFDETTASDATIFDVATGRAVGRAVPTNVFAGEPRAAIAGAFQYGLENGRAVVIDLASGAVARSARIACPKDAFLGNPLLSPTGDWLLVTCGPDGIALDPRTLAAKRRYSRILPGCDNGYSLPAHYDAKSSSVLVVEGCGGEARLDLKTGKYTCSDDVGLVGADYEIVALAPGVPSRRAPAGRENLPRCTAGLEPGAPNALGSSGAYSFVYGEPPEIVHAGGKLALDAGTSLPAISPDESKIAYELKDRVVVRSLPSGAVLHELRRR